MKPEKNNTNNKKRREGFWNEPRKGSDERPPDKRVCHRRDIMPRLG